MSHVLHIVGCGRAGRTLARLWAEQGTFRIGWIVNRSVESSEAAAAFIGQGTPASEPGPVASDEWLMLAVPDGDLESAVSGLAGRLSPGPSLAFHISGSEPSAVLRPLGERIASVHPVCPFGDPQRALADFAGSYAVGEAPGEDGRRALDVLLPCFEAIGARPVRFEPTDKRLYHAATIAGSNFLNVLDDLALGLAEDGGMERDNALKVLVALQRSALAGIEAAGPVETLTGPIERGDERICRRLAELFGSEHVRRDELFRALARGAATLAARKHGRESAYGDEPFRDVFAEPGFVRSGPGHRRQGGGDQGGSGNGGV